MLFFEFLRFAKKALQHAWHPPRPCPEERSSHVAAEPLRHSSPADGQRHRGDPEMREAARRAVRDDRCGRGRLYLYDLSTALAPRRAYGIGRPRPATARDGTPQFPHRRSDRDNVEMRCVRKTLYAHSNRTVSAPTSAPARVPRRRSLVSTIESRLFVLLVLARARGAPPSPYSKHETAWRICL